MALGKRSDEQQEMWVATTSLRSSVPAFAADWPGVGC